MAQVPFGSARAVVRSYYSFVDWLKLSNADLSVELDETDED
jgi:hypothetical protein